MGTVTKSIGTTGRDYSTLAAWEAALPANLVTDGNAQVGECYNDSEFTPTYFIIAARTTDATNFVKLTAAAGQSFQDHASVQTNALRYNQANGVAVTWAPDSGWATIRAYPNYTVISRLQIRSTNSGDAPALRFNGSPTKTVVDSCILYNSAGASTGYAFASHVDTAGGANCGFIKNSLLQVDGSAGLVHGYGIKAYNCTFVKTTNTGAGGNVITVEHSRASTFINCGFFGVSAIVDAGTPTYTTCFTDLTGTTGLTGSLTYADQFENTGGTIANADFRIKTGSAMIDTGTTDTTNIPEAVDIALTARPQGSAWDGGAWELVSGGGGGGGGSNHNQLIMVGCG